MKKLFLILFISFSAIPLKSQTNLDSLFTIWQDQTLADSTRTNAYSKYIWDGFLFSNPDTAFYLAQSMFDYSYDHNYEKAKAMSYLLMGSSTYLQSNYPKALHYYQSGLQVYEAMGNEKGSANCINNIGNIYKAQGEYSKALDYYQRSLLIQEEIRDKLGSSNAIGNIGLIYNLQGDYTKSLDYFQRSLRIKQETEDKQGSAYAMGNIGGVYINQGDYTKALGYFERSLKIEKEIGDKRGSAKSISDIGLIYLYQKDYPKSLDYYQLSLTIYKETGDKKGRAASLSSIGTTYYKLGDYLTAVSYCEKALLITKEIGALNEEKIACQCLYDTHKAMGQGNVALVYLESLQVISDSLKAEETSKKLQQMEFKEVMLKDSIAKSEEARLVQEAHKKEVRQGEKTRNVAFVAGLVLLILAGALYGRNRYIKKSRDIISKEKDRSDNLLLNILPAEIAAELKEKGRADAQDFELVSILFTDFKGFTAASEKLSAQELVAEINTCFEDFDGIMGKFKIEKIKTIGDSYMAAGGLPVATEDSVKNTVLAALQMQDFITTRKVKMDSIGAPSFEMRLGIHTGPVVAGIVGVKKFAYDIWGDTVNIASRMESSGEVGKVNISEATYELLKEDADFTFESRGKIEAKGKGEMEMYFVSKT